MNTQNLIRWAGIPAIFAGVIFAAIQPVHPPDFLPSVTTQTWVIIQSLKALMAVLYLFGIVGLYARQGKAAGWLGLIGFLLFFLNWVIELPYIFTEAFVLPALAHDAPRFVEGFLGIVNESAPVMNLGVLPGLYALSSIMYLLGSLLFGIATYRARILSRRAAVLFAASGPLAVILVSVLPHQYERLAAMPMGLAMAWLGWSLLMQRRAATADRAADLAGAQLRPSEAG